MNTQGPPFRPGDVRVWEKKNRLVRLVVAMWTRPESRVPIGSNESQTLDWRCEDFETQFVCVCNEWDLGKQPVTDLEVIAWYASQPATE